VTRSLPSRHRWQQTQFVAILQEIRGGGINGLIAQDCHHAAAEALIRALTGDNAGHAVAYATEAGLFQGAGYSAAICGPGSIDQAHQPDEYISIDQFEQVATTGVQSSAVRTEVSDRQPEAGLERLGSIQRSLDLRQEVVCIGHGIGRGQWETNSSRKA
jgi:hypothetical protein